MPREQLDYERRRPVSAMIRSLDLVAMGGLLVGLAWFGLLSYTDHTGPRYPNRVFGRPALLISLIGNIWGALRFKSVPVIVRVLCFPVALAVGYAGIGLIMILINAGLRW